MEKRPAEGKLDLGGPRHSTPNLVEVFMDWLLQLLFGWWWHAQDGRTKTADASDRYVLPILLLVAVACLIALVVWAAR